MMTTNNDDDDDIDVYYDDNDDVDADADDDDDDDDDDDGASCHRDALLKMQDVYRQNTKLGDPTSLDPQLEENAQKLDQLQKEVTKYQAS